MPRYEVIYLSDLGYVVYRHSFDLRKCTLVEGARAHKVAAFVEENNAKAYVEWRNATAASRRLGDPREGVHLGRPPKRS